MRIHLTDSSFRRIAQAMGILYDDVVALARRVDSRDISGDDLRVTIGNLAVRYDVPEFEVWGLMGEVRAQERADREEYEDAMSTVNDLKMRPYTFDPDLYTKGYRSADVGGQTHLPSYSIDEKNIGDFGSDKDQMSDSAYGNRHDIEAEGSREDTKYQQTDYLGNPPWKDPHRDKYNDQDVEEGFPGDVPPGKRL